jgi:hypothetical protein
LQTKPETPPVVLLVAPTAAKSTLMRAAAVQYAASIPKRGGDPDAAPQARDEQIEMLRKEHTDFNAAVWRGRHADDPDSPDPKRPASS